MTLKNTLLPKLTYSQAQATLALKNASHARQWWHTPLILALGRQRQADSEFQASLVYEEIPGQIGMFHRETVSHKTKQNSPSEFQASLVYKKSSRTDKDVIRGNRVSKQTNKKQNKKKNQRGRGRNK